MLTDNDLRNLIINHYADAEMHTPLAAVEKRGITRRRNRRVGFSAITVLALAAIGGMSAITLGQPHISAAEVSQACDARYASVIAARPDHEQLPAALGQPVIDLRHGNAVFRVYGDTTTTTGKRYIFDCERSAKGQVQTDIVVAVKANDEIYGDAAHAYRDYFPDGSGAVVGTARDVSSTVTANGAGGHPQIAKSGNIFAVWSNNGDLDKAQIAVTTVHGKEWSRFITTGLDIMPVRFNAEVIAAACNRIISGGPNGQPAYVGPAEPALVLTHDDQGAVMFRGNTAYVCSVLGPPEGTQLLPELLNADPRPTTIDGVIEYVAAENGSPGGFLVGLVPSDVTDVRLQYTDGEVVHARIHDGVFGCWISVLDSGESATVIATSPTKIYTIVGGKVTTQDR